MKILYISNFDLPDFQSDMIFHGLRSVFGEDCIDYNEAWYMYDDMRKYWNYRVPENGMSYGRGFTLYGRLPKINIDRSNLYDKIKNKFFDKIIYGSITRNSLFLNEVIQIYNKKDIILIDGEDNTHIDPKYFGNGIYFKRELVYEPNDQLRPIGFCIPDELVINDLPKKEKDYGTVIPGSPETYIYTEEKPYFEDYQKSYFGVTFKKGGWDCLRHYEILMNGCIPYFPQLEKCPQYTMCNFPKDIIIEVMNIINKEDNILNFYDEYANMLLRYTKEKLTTKKVIESIL